MKKSRFIRFKHGFTIVEFLVVFVMIALFSGIGLAYYGDFSQNKLLETETERLRDTLELYKKRAFTYDAGSCTSFNGYQFIFNGTNSYQINKCCSSSCSAVSEKYSLASGIFVKDSASFQFNSSPGSTNIAGTSISITVQSRGINKCIPVIIYSSGVVEVGSKISC